MASAGVCQPRILRGREFSSAATASRWVSSQRDRSVPLGKYWRKSPFVFSFVPRCEGLCGSVKNTGIPVSTVNEACAESYLPRSQVSDRVSWAGSVDIEVDSALAIVTAP